MLIMSLFLQVGVVILNIPVIKYYIVNIDKIFILYIVMLTFPIAVLLKTFALKEKVSGNYFKVWLLVLLSTITPNILLRLFI